MSPYTYAEQSKTLTNQVQCMEEPKQVGSVPLTRRPFSAIFIFNSWVTAGSLNFRHIRVNSLASLHGCLHCLSIIMVYS